MKGFTWKMECIIHIWHTSTAIQIHLEIVPGWQMWEAAREAEGRKEDQFVSRRRASGVDVPYSREYKHNLQTCKLRYDEKWVVRDETQKLLRQLETIKQILPIIDQYPFYPYLHKYSKTNRKIYKLYRKAVKPPIIDYTIKIRNEFLLVWTSIPRLQ